MTEKLIVAGLLLPIIFLVTFSVWKKTFWFVLYWAVVVGAIRKWFLPQLADVTLFSIHLFLFGLYCIVFFSKKIKTGKYGRPVTFLIAASILWGCVSFVNPRNPSAAVGVLGLIIYFYFVPFAYALPIAVTSFQELVRGLQRFALFSAPILLLGAVQYSLPADHYLNRYVDESMYVALVGGAARITSTFSYISGYTAYLNALVMILIFLFVAQKGKSWLRIVFFVLLVLAFINLFMTGSRGPVFIAAISLAVYFMTTIKLGLKFFIKTLVWTLLVLGLVGLTVSQVGSLRVRASTAFNNFMLRTEQAKGDVSGRLEDTFTPFKFLDHAGLLGYGIGTTYQGAVRFVSDWGDMPRDFEEEPERVVLEIGLVGYILTYGLRLVVLFYLLRLFFALKIREHKLLALSAFLFQI